MARSSWLVDSNRIATKIRSASGATDPQLVNWTSDPTRTCPNCQHTIDNSDVTQEWPGLPRGVKFDPSDQEIIWHLLGKVGVDNLKPHPFLDEFIPTVNEDDGICYTHPQNLPGVKQDGSVSHFFHRAIKAYNTGTRKRRKIHGATTGDVRWHKTGRTKPVHLDGVQKGCKKIMVLYLSPAKGGKPEKTNWVMHQYHLGTEEDEREGQYVISKVFYQQQQLKQSEKNEVEVSEEDIMTVRGDPVTPKSVTPAPPRAERRHSDMNYGQEPIISIVQHDDVVAMDHHYDELSPVQRMPDCEEGLAEKEEDKLDEDAGEKLWDDNESQYLLDSQQLVEGLSLFDDLLQSQSPPRDGNKNDKEQKTKPRISDYARLGTECFKKDLEDCQNLVLDPANLELDTPPDFRLSQLEFGSQDSFLSWGGAKADDIGGQDS
ncbi:OLC1v1032391C1 [Oldenlandia corymbosa var. corymbosa]|uniref:OLC1v1032391C1 n=1 Tax=Oldenlandia corymbosa var. corymbosa TaxID=529605 RepID=A0AAV1CNY9_OLDCO|nr:OLC1v1032391C1 [Oldenlandia corymbosa var. corymbosa]